MKRGVIKGEGLRGLVVDEADEMLGRGFKDIIYEVILLLVGEVQMVVVSATVDNEVSNFIQVFFFF